MKNIIVLILVGLLLSSQMIYAGEIFSEDFTDDPGWPSTEPTNVKWDPAGFYRARVTDNPSGFVQWGSSPVFEEISNRSFSLEFDINPVDPSWGTYPLLGLVAEGVPHPFDDIPLSIGAERADEFPNNFVMRGKPYGSSSPVYFSSPVFAVGEWYHQRVDYDAASNTLTWKISLVGMPDGSFYSIAYTNISVAPFNQVVVGYEGNPPVYGSWAEIYVDNIVVSIPEPAGYTWHEYNGHLYALTLGVGNWEEAEAEAIAVGGHLVTINDANENAWLGSTFNPQIVQDDYLWIGLYQDHEDPNYSEPAGGWKWISGEPVTFLGWTGQEPTNHPPGEDYGTLTGGTPNHWNDWGPERPDFHPIHGIIEVAEPAEPNIAVSPLSHDFGDVELGTSSTVIVTISNVGNGDLNVSGIALETDFAITSAPAAAIVVEPDATVDVEITYTPTVLGYNSAVLKISSDDPDEPVVEVQLSAAGVEIPPPPSEQIANILAFFDTSVDDGTLAGDGPGSSAEKRLNALRNMIEAAGDLIENELFEESCQQLLDVYRRMDGQPKPPDFVKGEAVPELATMLQDLMTSLGCE